VVKAGTCGGGGGGATYSKSLLQAEANKKNKMPAVSLNEFLLFTTIQLIRELK
jgi:hypothetical protein